METESVILSLKDRTAFGAISVALFLRNRYLLDMSKCSEILMSLNIDIEAAIKQLSENNTFVWRELLLLDLYSRGFTYADMAAIYSCKKHDIIDKLVDIFENIFSVLGEDYFSV